MKVNLHVIQEFSDGIQKSLKLDRNVNFEEKLEELHASDCFLFSLHSLHSSYSNSAVEWMLDVMH